MPERNGKMNTEVMLEISKFTYREMGTVSLSHAHRQFYLNFE
jgi:hypothetical protein